MASFYAACDIFVFASHREGLIAAARSHGVGMRRRDDGLWRVSDFARHDENCLMVPPGDSERCRRHPDCSTTPRWRKLSAAAVRTASSWPRERMTTTFLDRVAQVAC
jgi:hypothetical protein